MLLWCFPKKCFFRPCWNEHRPALAGTDWLPGRNLASTMSVKSAWEVTPYYTRAYEKGCLFVRGDKPKELAAIAKITARQWHRYKNGRHRDNPILKGLQCLKVFEDESVRTYAQAAEILGVSRERVYQLTALVTKLPPQIKDFLIGTEDPAVLRFFTERRLRPLTMIPDGEKQMAQFAELLTSAKDGTNCLSMGNALHGGGSRNCLVRGRVLHSSESMQGRG